MHGRSTLALVAITILAAPIAAAAPHSGGPYVTCPGEVTVDAEGYAGAEVDPAQGCGVGYDPGSNRAQADVTYEQVRVSVWGFLLSGLDLPTSYELGDDVDHPLDVFLAELDDLAEELPDSAPQSAPAVTMDDDGIHVATGETRHDVPWPRDPVTGNPMMGPDEIFVPEEYTVSTDETYDRGVALLISLCRSHAEDTCAMVPTPELPEPVPDVTADFRVADLGPGTVTRSFVPATIATERRHDPDPGVRARVPDADGDVVSGISAGQPTTSAGSGSLASAPSRVARDPVASGGVALLAVLGSLGAIALFRRLKENDVLDHPLRSEVFTYICDHPGVTVQEVSDALEVDYSTARHHAAVLLEFGLVNKRCQGRITHYFENHGTYGSFEKEVIPLLRDGTSGEIARLVQDNPGITPSALARRLEVDPSTVKWHLDKLRDADVVDAEPLDGRSLGLVVPEAARDTVDRWT